jgi:hypothetical protein
MEDKNNLTNTIYNYRYYKSTESSGCISTKYNFEYNEEQNLVIVDNTTEISGNYISK